MSKKPIIEVVAETYNDDNDDNNSLTSDIEQEEQNQKNIEKSQQQQNQKNESEEKGDKKQQQNASSTNKSLLRLEKDYFEGVKHESKFESKKGFVVDQLLNSKQPNSQDKISQQLNKPNFAMFEQSSLLSKLQNFMPQFKQDTDNLLNNADELQKKQMDIQLVEDKKGEKTIENDNLSSENEEDKMDSQKQEQKQMNKLSNKLKLPNQKNDNSKPFFIKEMSSNQENKEEQSESEEESEEEEEEESESSDSQINLNEQLQDIDQNEIMELKKKILLGLQNGEIQNENDEDDLKEESDNCELEYEQNGEEKQNKKKVLQLCEGNCQCNNSRNNNNKGSILINEMDKDEQQNKCLQNKIDQFNKNSNSNNNNQHLKGKKIEMNLMLGVFDIKSQMTEEETDKLKDKMKV